MKTKPLLASPVGFRLLDILCSEGDAAASVLLTLLIYQHCFPLSFILFYCLDILFIIYRIDIDICCNLQLKFSGINTFIHNVFYENSTSFYCFCCCFAHLSTIYSCPDTVYTLCYVMVIFSYLLFYFYTLCVVFIALSKEAKNLL